MAQCFYLVSEGPCCPRLWLHGAHQLVSCCLQGYM